MSRPAVAFITNPNIEEMSGPDFLLAIADKEQSLGNDINAEAFRRRAQQWQRDLNDLHALPPVGLPAANSEWPAHLPPLRRASELPAYHITPFDHR